MARPKAPPVKIIVDVHERQSGIADTLAELGAEIEIARLPAGDYAVGADTLVEPKRALDLHAAVLKGRLWPLPSAASSSSRLPSGPPTRSDPDRSRVTRLRRPSSPPCPASRRPPRAPYSSASAASPPWLPPTGPTGSPCPGSGRSALALSRKPSTSAGEAVTHAERARGLSDDLKSGSTTISNSRPRMAAAVDDRRLALRA